MDINKLTPTQRRLFDVLADGQPHTLQELHQCLDHLTGVRTVSVHLTAMRKVLRPAGLDVFSRTVRGHEATYHLVRLLASPYRG